MTIIYIAIWDIHIYIYNNNNVLGICFDISKYLLNGYTLNYRSRICNMLKLVCNFAAVTWWFNHQFHRVSIGIS
jgi:hypothetical protein